MKIKSLMYVLMGTMLVVACTDSNNEEGIVDNGGGDDSRSYVIPAGFDLQLVVLSLLKFIQVSL